MVVLATHLVAVNVISIKSLVHLTLWQVWLYAVTFAVGLLTLLTFAMLFDNRMRLGSGRLDPRAARRWLIGIVIACPFGAGFYYLRVVASHGNEKQAGTGMDVHDGQKDGVT